MVELPVVIAIVAAMLLPALVRAKAKGKGIACISNQRQLGLAMRMYADDDSRGWLPATSADIAGPAADPDGDQVVNVMECALDLNPKEFSTAGFPTASLVTTNGRTYGALTFTRVKGAIDLVYEPSARSTLNGGAWTVLTNVMTVEDHGETETVTVRDDEPVGTHDMRYLQLRVKLNYP